MIKYVVIPLIALGLLSCNKSKHTPPVIENNSELTTPPEQITIERSGLETKIQKSRSEVMRIETISKLTQLIKDLKIDPSELLVSFDMDLTIKGPQVVTEGRPSFGFRESQTTLDALTDLSTQGINFIINSAAGAHSTASIWNAALHLGVPRNSRFDTNCTYTNPDTNRIDTRNATLSHYNDFIVGQCDQVVSAGYDKEVGIEYFIETYQLAPSWIIHIDDGAINILNLYEHFKGNSKYKFLGLYYPHALSSGEPFQEESEDALNPLFYSVE
jgi:hypothetical protein